MRRNRVPFALLAVGVVGLLFVGVGSALAQDPVEVTRLGGPNAFHKPAKRLLTAPEFQKMCADRNEEITRLFHQAGWPGTPGTFFAAVAEGRFKETEVAPGTRLNWMMARQKRQPSLIQNLVWAGRKPFPAFEVTVEEVLPVRQKVTTTFVVPKACGNIALLNQQMEELPPPPPPPVEKKEPPRAEIRPVGTVSPESTCVCREVVLDYTGTTATLEGRPVQAKFKAVLFHPDGHEMELAGPGPRWNYNSDRPGQYRVVVTVTVDDEYATRAEQTVTFQLTACPPQTALVVRPEEVVAGESVTIDASGSQARTGSLSRVVVAVSRDGQKVRDLELTGNLQASLALDKPGTYRFEAVAHDDCGGRSETPATAGAVALSRFTGFVGIMGGLERRFRRELDDVNVEPLLAFKLGLGYQIVPRKIELAGALGSTVALDNGDYYSAFADLYFNYLLSRGFIGVGAGGWDLTHAGDRTGHVMVHGGVDLPWRIRHKPLQLSSELRFLLDTPKRWSDNIVWLTGLKLNF